MEGWIKLHRKIREHWIFSNAEYLKAWITIIFEVNHKDSKVLINGELIECKRGQSVNSLSTWASIFGKNWSIQKVRTFFKLLQKDEMINLEGLRKTTRLTVINYDTYQDNLTDKQHTANTQTTCKQHTANTQTTCKQHTANTQLTTNKNDKNVKNEKNKSKDQFFISLIPPELNYPEFLETWQMWIEYRKKDKKKPVTERSAKMQLKLLAECANPIEVINLSIMNGWQGLFPEKVKSKYRGSNGTNRERSPEELAEEAQEFFEHLTTNN